MLKQGQIWKTSRIFAKFLIVFVFLGVLGCSKHDKHVVTVGVNQFAQHPILDAVYQGLKEDLEKEGVKVELRVANADVNAVHQINTQFINEKVDVIVPLGTPAAQSAVNLTKNIPIVFGAITDPVAAKLADSMEKPGGNKTGTTNRWPFVDQVKLIKQIKPNVKKVGILINPGEENCVAGMKYIEQALNEEKLAFSEVPVSNTSEILSAMKSLVGKVDVVFISPSNVVVSGASGIIKVAQDNNILVIGGDRGTVLNGSLITYGYDNVEIGRATAGLVLKILKEKLVPGDIPVTLPPTTSLYINETAAKKSGIKFPTELAKAAKDVF